MSDVFDDGSAPPPPPGPAVKASPLTAMVKGMSDDQLAAVIADAGSQSGKKGADARSSSALRLHARIVESGDSVLVDSWAARLGEFLAAGYDPQGFAWLLETGVDSVGSYLIEMIRSTPFETMAFLLEAAGTEGNAKGVPERREAAHGVHRQMIDCDVDGVAACWAERLSSFLESVGYEPIGFAWWEQAEKVS